MPIRAILEAEHGPLFGPAEIAALRGTREEEMWLALAAITLTAALGFNVLALAIQFER